MPKIVILPQEEIEKSFTRLSRKQLQEAEMQPYRAAVAQLGNGNTGGVVELEEGENSRQVQMRLHRAARDAGFNIRFQRQSKNPTELKFRLQTDEENARLKERGRKLAQSRANKTKEK